MGIYLPLEQAGKPIFRGHDHYWIVIRDLDKQQGLWTVDDIFDHSSAVKGSIVSYVKKLEQAGYVTSESSGDDRAYFRLHRKQSKTPRISNDGIVCAPCSQQFLWNIMRKCGAFTVEELAFNASTKDIEINPKTAKSYVLRLAKVGILDKIGTHRYKQPKTFILPQYRNTGVHAPTLLRATMMFDVNTQLAVGEILASEVGEKAA